MTQLDSDIEQRLTRLRESTERIGARPGFEDSVMVLLAATPANDVSSLVLRWGKFGVAVGVLAAAAGVILALNQASVVEQEDALAYGTTEYFE